MIWQFFFSIKMMFANFTVWIFLPIFYACAIDATPSVVVVPETLSRSLD
jgi:hypothetical protein